MAQKKTERITTRREAGERRYGDYREVQSVPRGGSLLNLVKRKRTNGRISGNYDKNTKTNV